jgi:hypothetical protein
MIPGISQFAEAVIHHPETPSIVTFSHSTKFLLNKRIITGFWLILKYRYAYTEKQTGLSDTHPEFLMSIPDQFSFFCRP